MMLGSCSIIYGMQQTGGGSDPDASSTTLLLQLPEHQGCCLVQLLPVLNVCEKAVADHGKSAIDELCLLGEWANTCKAFNAQQQVDKCLAKRPAKRPAKEPRRVGTHGQTLAAMRAAE